MDNWRDYYSWLGQDEQTGGPLEIDSRMLEYGDNLSLLASDLADVDSQIILLFPSAQRDSSLGLLHQCVVGEQLTGIPDLLRHTPPRSVSLVSVTRQSHSAFLRP